MRKINVFIIAAFLLLLFLPTTPVYAEAPPTDLNLGDKIILESGEEAIYLGQSGEGYRFRATLGAPVYIPGTTTEIKPNWYYNHNTTQWESDANLFDAIVKDSKVTVWKDGQKMSWEPTVLVGTKDHKALIKEPTLLSQDPINENYLGNTLEWDYGVCKRHLRVIEGVLLEYFIFETNPGVDVQIKSNLYKDPNFIWDKDPFAYDAEGLPIEVSTDKIVLATEFNRTDISYPITIDPTSTYTVTSSDGWMVNESWADCWRATSTESWNDAHDFVTADGVYPSGNDLEVHVATNGLSGYRTHMFRPYLYFDTSGLPDGCEVDSAILKLYGTQAPEVEHGSWHLQIQSGMPTYPHDPLVGSDFYYNYYSGDGGTLASGDMGTGYKDITLSATGKSWIDVDGTTKFCLREEEHDINDVKPSYGSSTEVNDWEVYSYEKGSGYWPQLEVTYSAASAPTVTTQAATDESTTTAKVHGYLDNDGGEECRVKFQYDTDSGVPYADDTGWLATNYTTGQSFDEILTGLNVDDTYYYRVGANNTAGTSWGSELTFATLASLNPPTDFKAIPRSSTEISSTWVKGVGASQTLVRYKVGSYPTTTSDGTLAYNGTRGSCTITGLTPGTTYGIKAWGYDAGGFSTSNVTEMATTFLGEAPGDSPFTAPGELPNFWGPPSYTNLSNIPFYENFNARADDIGMDRGNFWMMIFWMFAITIGAGLFMMTKDPTWGMFGVSIGVVWGWQAGPIPGVWMLVYVVAAIIIIYVLGKGGAHA